MNVEESVMRQTYNAEFACTVLSATRTEAAASKTHPELFG
jgi:hypothetical protein